MKKSEIWTCEATREVCRHGGRAVLVLESSLPAGETPVAAHFRAMCERLFAYARDAWLPEAAQALEEAVAQGRGYAFTPITVRLFAEIHPARGGVCVTLTMEQKRGGEPPFWQVLDTYWSVEGTLQLKRPCHARRREAK